MNTAFAAESIYFCPSPEVTESIFQSFVWVMIVIISVHAQVITYKEFRVLTVIYLTVMFID